MSPWCLPTIYPLLSHSPPALNFPSIRVFWNKSALHIRWPQYWSFSFNISPSHEHPGMISFRMDWVDSLEKTLMLEGLGARGQGDDRRWDSWMASLTRWTWVWVNSRSWWWIGRTGVLWFMELQRVGHDWATELNWKMRAKSQITCYCLKIIVTVWTLERLSFENCYFRDPA